MPHSTRSSSASAPCRLEWRPSRCVIGALLVLGVFGAISILASGMPVRLAWPGAVLALVWGAWLAWREAHRPARQLTWPADDAPVTLDGEALQLPELRWRGSLAFLSWHDDSGRHRSRYLSWWPDTLPPPARRELRLAAGNGVTAPGDDSMAH